MDDRQAISLKHAPNSGTKFRNYIERESVPAIPEFLGIPSNSYQFRFYAVPESEGIPSHDEELDLTNSGIPGMISADSGIPGMISADSGIPGMISADSGIG